MFLLFLCVPFYLGHVCSELRLHLDGSFSSNEYDAEMIEDIQYSQNMDVAQSETLGTATPIDKPEDNQ